MKKILVLVFLFGSVMAHAQAPFKLGAIEIDSVYFKASSLWIDEVSVDGTLESPTDNQIVSALSFKTFVYDSIPSWISDSLSSFGNTTAIATMISDSIDDLRPLVLMWTDTTATIATQYDLLSAVGLTSGDVASQVSDSLDVIRPLFRSDINDSLDVVRTLFRADINDSINNLRPLVLFWADTISTIATQYDITAITEFNSELALIDTVQYSGGLRTYENATGALRVISNESSYATDYVEILGGGGGSIGILFKDGGTTVGSFLHNGTQLQLNTADSLYIPYLLGTEEKWLGITTTGGIFSDSLGTAAWGLTKKLDLKDLLTDLQNGEMKWWYVDRETGELTYSYGMPEKPMEQLEAMYGMIEMLAVKAYEQQKKINTLYILFGILGIMFIGFLVYQIKINKKSYILLEKIK